MTARDQLHLLAALAGHVAGERCTCGPQGATCLPCRARAYADALLDRMQRQLDVAMHGVDG